MTPRRAASPPFEIENVERVDRGRLVATFDVILTGVRIDRCRCISTNSGAIVAGPALRPTRASAWPPSLAKFDPALAGAIKDAVQARLIGRADKPSTS